MTLSTLQVGDRAVIKNFRENSTLVARMMEMGLTVNTEITVEHEAPFGGAIAVRCRGGLIAIRRTDAENVEVAKC